MNHSDRETLHVWAIDDEPDVINIICDFLRGEGFAVEGYTDSNAAFESLMRGAPAPDVLLVDIMMPGMDGYDFCQRLQQDARLREIPVIFLTGKDRIDDSLRFVNCGGQLYVKKPFHLSELRDLLLFCTSALSS